MLTIDPSAVVAVDADIQGEVRIGKGTFVHPLVQITARHGPVVIGERCVIEERVVIINDCSEEMVIGNDTLIGIASYIESSSIGQDNAIEPMCRIEKRSKTGNCCAIGAKVVITANSVPSEMSLQPPFYGHATLSADAQLHIKTDHKMMLQYLTILGAQWPRWIPPAAAENPAPTS